MRAASVLLFLAALLQGQGIVSTVVGTEWLLATGRPALQSPVGQVNAVTIDLRGRVVFAAPQSNMILRINTDGGLEAIAGNGIAAYSGDGGKATDASLNGPSGVAYDSQGNLLISDSLNCRIRRVSAEGTITTIAGTGRCRFSGDGRPAELAEMDVPLQLVLDSRQNIYFHDLGAKRIRRISAQGTISTYAGNGSPWQALDNVAATSFGFAEPAGLAIDAGNRLYVADRSAFRIYRIDTTGMISLVAGGGDRGEVQDGLAAARALLIEPQGLAVDGRGALYWGEAGTSRIRTINTFGNVQTVAGVLGEEGFRDGSSNSALFFGPAALAIDRNGSIVVADMQNRRVRRVEAGGVSTIAGNGGFQGTGDGEPSVRSFLNLPNAIERDRDGSILIADTGNSLVRRSRDGRMSNVAGNGVRKLGPDNPVATMAPIGTPLGVTADVAGSLWFSEEALTGIAPRLRRITSQGAITSHPTRTGWTKITHLAGVPGGELYIAGLDATGGAIYRVSADGQEALLRTPGAPFGIAADANGNLYFSDDSNAIVWRFRIATGEIGAYAGGGTQIVRGTRQLPASQVSLGKPAGVAVDQTGTLYIADRGHHVVYAVSNGMVRVAAGTGVSGFGGDGGQAMQALFNQPSDVDVDAAGNIYVADTGNGRVRVIRAIPPVWQVSPTRLTFHANAGAEIVPQSVSISSAFIGLRFTAAIGADTPWLKLSQADGLLPATLQISLDNDLAPGSYRGNIRLTSPGATPPELTVAVEVTIDENKAPARLVVDQTEISVSVRKGSGPVVSRLTVRNAGGGVLTYSLGSTTLDELGWLKVEQTGTLESGRSGQVNVLIDPTGLNADTYAGTIDIHHGDGTVKVPVTLIVTELKPRLVLSRNLLQFRMSAGGAAPLPQNVFVLNDGPGEIEVETDFFTSTGGGDWLELNTFGSVATAGQKSPPSVVVGVFAPDLAPGVYYGEIKLRDKNGRAMESPQSIVVQLTINPEVNSNLTPEVTPSALLFVGEAGSSPASQTLFLAGAGRDQVDYQMTFTAPDNGKWLRALPTNGVLAQQVAGAPPPRILVQPDFTTVSPGIYDAVLSVRFSNGTVRTVNILNVVAGASGDVISKDGRLAGECPLMLQTLTPASNFESNLGNVIPLRVRLINPANCNLSSVRVFASVPSPEGRESIELDSKTNAEWAREWQPRLLTPGNIRIEFVAFPMMGTQIVSPLPGAEVSGTLRTAPVFSGPGPIPPPLRGPITNSATGEVRSLVAPGGLVTIYGEQLAASERTADFAKPPSELGGTRVELGGVPLPLLYVSPGQINAQIPYGLRTDEAHELLVRREGVPSIPERLSVARTQPGIFLSEDQSDGRQGAIYVVSIGSLKLADSKSPASAGDLIEILCAGLGEVASRSTNTVGDSPAVLNPVVVTIGGRPANLIAAVLDENAVGRYVITAQVPVGVAPGTAVPVQLITGRLSSPPVTMSLK